MKLLLVILIIFVSSFNLFASWQFNVKLTNIREVQLNQDYNNKRAITFVADNTSSNPVTCWLDFNDSVGKANLATLLSIKANSGIVFISFESSETPTTMIVPTRTLASITWQYQHIYFVATE